MSSNELHINNECPFCRHEWLDKVKDAGECPKCQASYSMQKEDMGTIDISWNMSEITTKIVSMLKAHGFAGRQYGMARDATGCFFSYECLSKYKTVTDFQLDYPFYA